MYLVSSEFSCTQTYIAQFSFPQRLEFCCLSLILSFSLHVWEWKQTFKQIELNSDWTEKLTFLKKLLSQVPHLIYHLSIIDLSISHLSNPRRRKREMRKTKTKKQKNRMSIFQCIHKLYLLKSSCKGYSILTINMIQYNAGIYFFSCEKLLSLI